MIRNRNRNRNRIRFLFIGLIGISMFVFLKLFKTIVNYRCSPAFILTREDFLRYRNESNRCSKRIPRRIHQTYFNRTIPLQWNRTVESVLKLNPNYEYYLWSHDQMKNFVEKTEKDFFLKTYRNYPFEAQRIDSFRYVVLYHLGGIYIDMDNGLKTSLEDILLTLECLDPLSESICGFPPDDAFGLQTDFQISSSHHPFYRQLIDNLHLFDHNYYLHHLTILLSAGPLFVTFQEKYFPTLENKQMIRHFHRQMYLEFVHWKVNGATWHRFDTKLILFIFYHRQQLFRLFIFIFIFSFIYFSSSIRQQTRRFSMFSHRFHRR